MTKCCVLSLLPRDKLISPASILLLAITPRRRPCWRPVPWRLILPARYACRVYIQESKMAMPWFRHCTLWVLTCALMAIRSRLRGGRRLRGIEMNGDKAIDCIPVLVAAACFAEGESVFYNIESLHYKESDRIDDLCAELRRAGCMVTPRQDAILVRGQPQGVEGGVVVDAHSDHRLLMALAIVALRSRHGLTLTGVEHIAKSYPHFFEDLRLLGAEII